MSGVNILHLGKMRSMSPTQRKMMKRRSAVESVIGHLKNDCRMRRNWLKGAMGDAIHAVLLHPVPEPMGVYGNPMGVYGRPGTT